MLHPRLDRTLASKLFALTLLFSAPFCCAVNAAEDPQTDCPAAFRPYSVAGTPLLDLLLNPAARQIVDRHLPGFLSKMPPVLVRATPPTLADILTIETIATEFSPIPKAALEAIDKDLAQLPLTREQAVARCARYDHTPPTLPSQLPHPAILVFAKSNGFRDDPSVNAAQAALKTFAEHHHWHLTFIDNAAVFNSAALEHFDAVVWNNVSGDVLTMAQRRDFKAYIEGGGAFAGFHGSGGDPFYDWDWYADTLIGARFLSHPMSPQFQEAKLKVADPQHPIVQGLAPEWTMSDEWYSFKSNPRAKGAHVLLTIDETTYKPASGNHDLRMGADHPMAWTQCIGKGRSFYTAIGHRSESYSEPNTARLMEQGIAWTLDRKSCPAD